MTRDDPTPIPLHPFAIDIDVLDRMLNFEIADDPHYAGMEIQGFDDPAHGRGILVFLNRRTDGKVDVYYETGLQLDPTNYEIGNGLGEWIETEFDVARLDVAETGVTAEVSFTDAQQRPIEVQVGDRTPRGRRMAAFLAPMGAAIAEPRALPLIWMSRFDLLRRSAPSPTIRIDGRDAHPGRLPFESLIRRRLIKVTSDLCAVAVNPASERPTPLATNALTEAARHGTAAVHAAGGGHVAQVRFDPPFPDMRTPSAVGMERGGWSVSIDDTPIVAGTWFVRPSDDRASVELDVTDGWRPSGLPLLMSTVTRVAAVFRTWPTTYRWTATVADGDPPTMTSQWVRTEDDRGESYRAITRSA